ncbi:translation initiation factor IF-2-like [Tyto alba]|uniref:translation initiation factor IF-2-like n=1 Tax=Tyto alba TaxID=56313 RepID=UPI001C66B505|nr:translation initiation factor IF-2-like [Tyto alba]
MAGQHGQLQKLVLLPFWNPGSPCMKERLVLPLREGSLRSSKKEQVLGGVTPSDFALTGEEGAAKTRASSFSAPAPLQTRSSAPASPAPPGAGPQPGPHRRPPPRARPGAPAGADRPPLTGSLAAAGCARRKEAPSAGSGRGLSGAACPAPAEGRRAELPTDVGPGEGKPQQRLRAAAARAPQLGRAGPGRAGGSPPPPVAALPGQDGPARPYLAGEAGPHTQRLPLAARPASAGKNSNRRRVPGPAQAERDRRPATDGRACRDSGQLRPPRPARSVPLGERFGGAAPCVCHNLSSPAENVSLSPCRGEPSWTARLAEAVSTEVLHPLSLMQDKMDLNTNDSDAAFDSAQPRKTDVTARECRDYSLCPPVITLKSVSALVMTLQQQSLWPLHLSEWTQICPQLQNWGKKRIKE